MLSPLFRNQEVVVYGVHVPQNVGKKRIELNMTIIRIITNVNMTIISTSDILKTYPHVFFTLYTNIL